MTEAAFSEAQVAEYQAARDVLARRIRDLLHTADAITDPMERRNLDESVAALSRQRGSLKVGSDEVKALLAEEAPAQPKAGAQPSPKGSPGPGRIPRPRP